jgi:TolA-binding protein
MADCYEQSAAVEDARLAYEQFLTYFPESELRPAVKFRLGMLYFTGENPMQAAVMFTAVLEDSLQTDMASAALYNLALCQRSLSAPAEAQVALERYRRTYPRDQRTAQVAFQLGDLHETAGRLREAAAEFEQAVAAGPAPEARAEINYRLGQTREKLADEAGAVRAYEQAMAARPAADPFRLSAVARLAAVYEQRGKIENALACYRDIARNSSDSELAAAAQGRVAELAPRSPGKKSRPAGKEKSSD